MKKAKKEVERKEKAGTAWSHSYLNQKPWHPLSYPNQRRKWIAEQTDSQKEDRRAEVAREFAQEQEFFRQTAQMSKKEKEKMENLQAVSFMYMRPPGYNAEAARAAELADERKRLGLTSAGDSTASAADTSETKAGGDGKKKQVAKDVFGRALPSEQDFPVLINAPRHDTGVAGRVKPFAVEIRNVKCARCGASGHQSGDRECPMKDAIMPNEEARLQREDPLNLIMAHAAVDEPVTWELKQKPGGLSPARGGFRPDDPNQQIIPDEDIYDEYGGFILGGADEGALSIPNILSSITNEQRRELTDVKAGDSSKRKKRKKKKSKRRNSVERKYSSSDSDRERRQKTKQAREEIRSSHSGRETWTGPRKDSKAIDSIDSDYERKESRGIARQEVESGDDKRSKWMAKANKYQPTRDGRGDKRGHESAGNWGGKNDERRNRGSEAFWEDDEDTNKYSERRKSGKESKSRPMEMIWSRGSEASREGNKHTNKYSERHESETDREFRRKGMIRSSSSRSRSKNRSSRRRRSRSGSTIRSNSSSSRSSSSGPRSNHDRRRSTAEEQRWNLNGGRSSRKTRNRSFRNHGISISDTKETSQSTSRGGRDDSSNRRGPSGKSSEFEMNGPNWHDEEDRWMTRGSSYVYHQGSSRDGRHTEA